MRISVLLCVLSSLFLLPECLSNSLEECIGKAPSTKRKQSKMLTLFYGDAGFEVFNAIHASDVNYINLLATCVQTTMGVEPTTQSSRRGLSASSNITDITQSFKTALPKIVDTITKGIEYGFSKSKSRFRRKKTTFNGLTIKSVFHLHTVVGNMDLLRERLGEIQAAEDVKKNTFIIYGKNDLEKVNSETERKWDTETDKHMEQYMTIEPSDVRYYAVIPLNERSEFSGGEMLVRKTPNTEHYTLRSINQPTEAKKRSEHEHEEQEEAEREEQEEEMQLRSIQEEKRPKYDKFTRFTPDRGSILVLNGAHDVGIRPVTHGERKALIIEYAEDPEQKNEL